MSSTLEVQPETAARISELALRQGVSVDAYLLSLIGRSKDEPILMEIPDTRRLSLEEIDWFFDEIARHPSEADSSYQGTYSREDIYFDHD